MVVAVARIRLADGHNAEVRLMLEISRKLQKACWYFQAAEVELCDVGMELIREAFDSVLQLAARLHARLESDSRWSSFLDRLERLSRPPDWPISFEPSAGGAEASNTAFNSGVPKSQ